MKKEMKRMNEGASLTDCFWSDCPSLESYKGELCISSSCSYLSDKLWAGFHKGDYNFINH